MTTFRPLTLLCFHVVMGIASAGLYTRESTQPGTALTHPPTYLLYSLPCDVEMIDVFAHHFSIQA